jgi:hypothetical protein
MLLSAGTAFAGPDWVEHGDAGSDLRSSQVTLGSGPMSSITGTLGSGRMGLDLEDMYLFRVLDPSIFTMKISGASFDAQLFIFNVTIPGEAFGLLGNDNTPLGNSPVITPMANDGTGATLKFPGVYAVAISGAGRVPVSINGPIFNFVNPNELSGPDGPGGLNPHIGWSGEGQTGDYNVQLTGVGFYDVPTPGSSLVVLGAGVAAARRRRR